MTDVIIVTPKIAKLMYNPTEIFDASGRYTAPKNMKSIEDRLRLEEGFKPTGYKPGPQPKEKELSSLAAHFSLAFINTNNGEIIPKDKRGTFYDTMKTILFNPVYFDGLKLRIESFLDEYAIKIPSVHGTTPSVVLPPSTKVSTGPDESKILEDKIKEIIENKKNIIIALSKGTPIDKAIGAYSNAIQKRKYSIPMTMTDYKNELTKIENEFGTKRTQAEFILYNTSKKRAAYDYVISNAKDKDISWVFKTMGSLGLSMEATNIRNLMKKG